MFIKFPTRNDLISFNNSNDDQKQDNMDDIYSLFANNLDNVTVFKGEEVSSLLGPVSKTIQYTDKISSLNNKNILIQNRKDQYNGYFRICFAFLDDNDLIASAKKIVDASYKLWKEF
mmetsp:Transcript_105536/g.128815  ORF Transcript_105536/g.128815 Transcript_105536/m.128815 type:complete len:117 (+) Transcript_105536:43-393(+)